MNVIKSLIKDFLRFLFWYPLRLSVKYIPRRFYLAVIKQASKVVSRLSGGKQAVMRDLYREIVRERCDASSLAAMPERALAESHMNYGEILYYPHINKDNIQGIVRLEGGRHLDEALAGEKGVILAFFHFGAQKLIMPALGYRGYPIHQLAAPPTIWKEIDGPYRKSKMYLHSLDLEEQCEKNFPVSFHYIGKNLRSLLRCLQKGEILLYAVDGGYGIKKTIATRLGNLPFRISDTPFRLAAATGAAIVPAFLIRGSDNTHVLQIQAPIALGNEPQDFTEPAQRLMDMQYQYFVKYPCHYLGQLWLYKKMGRID